MKIWRYSILAVLIIFAIIQPVRADNDPERLFFTAEKVEKQGDLMLLRGNVVIQDGDTRLEGQSFIWDKARGIFKAPGTAMITRQNGMLVGDDLIYNQNTRTAEVYNVYGHAQNLSAGEMKTEGELFFWGEKAVWKGDKLFIYKVKTTTCDLLTPDQHYFMSADEVEVIPRNKMISRKVKLYFNGRRLLSKGTMVLSLKPKTSMQAQQSIFPRIANSRTDGMQVKFSPTYAFGDSSYGKVKLDYYAKSPFGKGLEHYFDFGDRGNANLYYYDQGAKWSGLSRNELSGSASYIFPNQLANFASYQSARYAEPGSDLQQTRSFTYNLNQSLKNHYYSLSYSTYDTTDAKSSSAILFDRLKLGKYLLNRLQVSTTTGNVPGNPGLSDITSYTINIKESLLFRTKFLELQGDWESAKGDEYFRLNRTPEFIVRFPRLSVARVPFLAVASYGRYKEEPGGADANRAFYRLALPDFDLTSGTRTRLTVGGGIRNISYDQGRQLNVGTADGSCWQALSDRSWAYLGYHYQDVNGVTPFLSDSYDSYNFLSGGFRFNNKNHWSMNVFGAYDFGNKKYQDLFASMKASVGKDGYISAGTDYDLDNNKFSGFDGQFDLQVSKALRVQYWGYYDQVNKQLLYQDYSIYHDNHCWAARLTYRMSQQQFWLQVMLKAFPSDATPIGALQDTVVMPQNWWERLHP
ncbi:MAG: hypothetical protein M1269_13155 [Chloroflexi bacterium]|nr:hypothetical protein [Chloroflexota bacterium]